MIDTEMVSYYKFRSSENIEQSLDIINNGRLYCAPWDKLNDPMEGIFYFRYGAKFTNFWKKHYMDVVSEKAKIRICALSRTLKSPLLWAHYANGFKGLAIELQFSLQSISIKDVSYSEDIPEINLTDNFDPYQSALSILTNKLRHWEYEDEVRVIQNQEYYILENPIKSITVGNRMNTSLRESLNIICKAKKIQFRIADPQPDRVSYTIP